MRDLVPRAWRALNGRLQWRLLWIRHATFMIGVTGVVRDDDGRVLLLRHRLWREGAEWGLPTGYAQAGERFQDTIVREVGEETGLQVRVDANLPVHVESGYRLRVEIAYDARFVGGELALDAFEIEDAGWFDVHDLPDGLAESHRRLIAG